ncbi:putative metallo-hydrolase YflN [Paenibacillus allorhizoplanae]|uniref:Metallo-hydrolase YflN n=2 Tax=Paenibacillus allorhizoplanae TaxID=2905648 RepID=A0ABN8H1G9_9BACL|nr:putative metallo-hydrolase YflN [Paenibacillus allorhizoplanae]
MEHTHNGDMKDTLADNYIPMTSIRSGVGEEVSHDLFCYTNQIVNISLVGTAEDWVLVDTGMPQSANHVLKIVEDRFGAESRPKAIILTHGHFDHVGAVIDLVVAWNVFVYAHELELPYLTGQTSYPEPDGSVEGGILAKISPFFPNEPINLGSHVRALPSDGSIPGMPGWRWIHTSGHTPGHVSLFRDMDRALIAGDAFVTVEQDSLYKVITQKKQLTGPPVYFTTDWHAAEQSVKKLEVLKPSVAITGHGVPMSGEELTSGLSQLAADFKRIAVPGHGRYVDNKIQ